MDKYAKAIISALIAAGTATLTGLDDDVLTKAEWVIIGVAFFTALGFTWAVPNAAKPVSRGTRTAE